MFRVFANNEYGTSSPLTTNKATKIAAQYSKSSPTRRITSGGWCDTGAGHRVVGKVVASTRFQYPGTAIFGFTQLLCQ